MGNRLSRREFNRLLLSGVAGSALGLGWMPKTASASAKRVVVIGGGFGGATAARQLKMLDSSIAVTLVEPKAVFHTCPFSNWVLAGMKTMDNIAHTYTTLRNRYHVNVIANTATAIDALRQTVTLKGGKVLGYDRLVVSPGVDFRWDAIAGYNEHVASTLIPHAYEAGPQTMMLKRQLLAMKDGENVLICPPALPFRCPAAPYERASLVAHYLKQYKPKSKVIILDSKDGFTKQDLFMKGWERRYPGRIEWRSASAGGKVERVDASTMTVTTEFGDEKGGVINIIPPQKAGRIAVDAGLADSTEWCPVNPLTFESTIHRGIHVIGDATIAGPMPKSGVAASTQARAAAMAINSMFQGRQPEPQHLSSTCYSLIGPAYAVSVIGSYTQNPDGIVENREAMKLTSLDASDARLNAEQEEAERWYRQTSLDIWG